MNKYECEGLWWLPRDEETKVAGTFVYTPEDGGELSLVGSFKDIKDLNQTQKLSIILGITKEGKAITLLNVFERGTTLVSNGLQTSTYCSNWALIGTHFKKQEEVTFDYLYVRFYNMDEWLGFNPFKIEIKEKDGEPGVTEEINLRYKFPPKEEVAYGEDRLGTDYTYNGPRSNSNEQTIRHKGYFKVTFKTKQDLHYVLNKIYELQQITSLGMGQVSYPEEINLKSDACYWQPTKEKKILDTITFLYTPSFYAPIKQPKTRHNMVFTYWDIKEEFEKILNGWIQEKENYEPVFDLYYGTVLNQSQHMESRFLSLAQALEILHRRTIGGVYMEKEEYRKIVKKPIKEAIPKTLPDEFREALEQKIGYLNEYSLRKRVTDIITPLQKNNLWFVDKDYIALIADTRNYLTHYNERLKEKAAQGWELYNLIIATRYLIEAAILKKIGVSDTIIKSLLRKSEKEMIAISANND